MTTNEGTSRLDAMLDEMEMLLKTPHVGMALATRAVNSSLALLAVQGLRAYLAGNKPQSADDFRTVAEEIELRLRA